MFPLHYTEITRLALRIHGKNPDDMDPQVFKDQAEDIREKVLLAQQHGTSYVGLPFYMGILREWIEHTAKQKTLFNKEAWSHIIHGSASAGMSAGVSLGMRLRHMTVRSGALDHVRVAAAAGGLVVEAHVSEYFRKMWPGFWRPPDNEGIWRTGCWHDFKLELPSDLWLVDVLGPELRSGIYNLRTKKPVDLHLAAKITGRDVLWQGWRQGKTMREPLPGEGFMAPSRLIVALNCAREGIDWLAILKIASHGVGKRR